MENDLVTRSRLVVAWSWEMQWGKAGERERLQRDKRKLLKGMDMFIILLVIISQGYMQANAHQIVYFKCVQFCTSIIS